MNSFYIYSFKYTVGKRNVSATVIFCPTNEIDIDQLQVEIKEFYSNFYQTDKTIFVGGKDLNQKFKSLTNVSNRNKIFKYVPLKEENSFYDNLHFLSFDFKGDISQVNVSGTSNFDDIIVFKKQFIHFGLQNIFINGGGIVESTNSQHHFVFPSGKHSEKFLRVANILLYSPEILFLSFSLLKRIDKDEMKYIYCDTSSINSVAFGINELLKRLDSNFNTIPVNSFKSYEGLYDERTNLKSNSLILISASTSGTILEYLSEKQPHINSKNIVILYYLECKNPNKTVLQNVLCNLTKSDDNTTGLETFYQDKSDCCKLCESGSHPLLISGDVFLLEKPKVNSVLINADDVDVKNSSLFINLFMSVNSSSSILKVNYKEIKEDEGADRKYEIYIDYGSVIDNITQPRFKKHKKKLDAYINQYVPSNLKWIVYLQDESSEKLSKYIYNKVIENYSPKRKPKVISQNNFSEIKKDVEGSILIVGSCISNGKNLLYLSRALRDYSLRVIYFIGINRYSNLDSNKFLKTNLKYGTYGSDNSTFVEVEKISCTSNSKRNSWQKEVEFIKSHIPNVDKKNVARFLNERRKLIEDGYSNQQNGLSNSIFLQRIIPSNKYEELKIRRNSAFYDNESYADDVSQSDVYFNIAYVLNKLRNSDNNSHNLKQSIYVRNLISPSNLNRFNDGIIQASFLRAATEEELNYSIDNNLSKEICTILITIIKYWEQEQGEALLEFLFAIASQKMTIATNQLKDLLLELEKINHEIVRFYTTIIKNNCAKK